MRLLAGAKDIPPIPVREFAGKFCNFVRKLDYFGVLGGAEEEGTGNALSMKRAGSWGAHSSPF